MPCVFFPDANRRDKEMKRSEINQALKNMEEMIRKCGFHLPPFCDFTPD